MFNERDGCFYQKVFSTPIAQLRSFSLRRYHTPSTGRYLGSAPGKRRPACHGAALFDEGYGQVNVGGSKVFHPVRVAVFKSFYAISCSASSCKDDMFSGCDLHLRNIAHHVRDPTCNRILMLAIGAHHCPFFDVNLDEGRVNQGEYCQ